MIDKNEDVNYSCKNVKVKNVFKSMGFRTIAEAEGIDLFEFFKMPNCGRITTQRVANTFKMAGVKFKDSYKLDKDKKMIMIGKIEWDELSEEAKFEFKKYFLDCNRTIQVDSVSDLIQGLVEVYEFLLESPDKTIKDFYNKQEEKPCLH